MAITTVADLGSAGTLAYEKGARFPLRNELIYAQLPVVRPAPVTHNGGSYRFWFFEDITPNTTPLTETVDVTPDTLGDNFVDVAINEYGQAVGRTRKAKGTGMLDYDPALANVLGRAAGEAYDNLARTALMGGTHVMYGGDATSRATVDAADTLKAATVRRAVATLVSRNAKSIGGGRYRAIVHPFQSLDLREEVGDAAWLAPVIAQAKGLSDNGEIGAFGGADFIEANRVPMLDDAGAGTTPNRQDVYQALFIADEALACAHAANVSGPTPGIEVSPVVDKLNRFVHLGWYWLGGFGILRQDAVLRVETAATFAV